MKYCLFFVVVIMFASCKQNLPDEVLVKSANEFIDEWHLMAATADVKYFDMLAEDAIYLGTATEEVWTKSEFVGFGMPYFKKGAAWAFTAFERNVYLNEQKDMAWFNEKLNTWMGVCRGSGILRMNEEEWELVHYNLSISVPNEKTQEVISIIAK